MSLATRVTATIRKRCRSIMANTRANERLASRLRIGRAVREATGAAVPRELVDAAEEGVNAALGSDWLEFRLDIRKRVASAAAAVALQVQPFDYDQVRGAAEAGARRMLEEEAS
ncbi:MAG: hypothetical protein OXH38_11765 [Chloroflexi bacterium]|nr:hypothetical protein [Chloroflexota bacterium]